MGEALYNAIPRDPAVYRNKKERLVLYNGDVDFILNSANHPLDADKAYCNQIKYQCGYTPRSQGYAFNDCYVDDTEEQDLLDDKYLQEYSFNWLYQKSDAQAVSQRHLWFRSNLRKKNSVGGTLWRGLRRNPGEYIRFKDSQTFDDEVTARITMLAKDHESGVIEIGAEYQQDVIPAKLRGGDDNIRWPLVTTTRGKGWLLPKWEIIADFNDEFVFQETTGGGTVTASLNPVEGKDEVLFEIARAMQAFSVNGYGYSLTHSAVSQNVRVDMTGAGTLRIYPSSGGLKMQNLCQGTLGFAITGDKIGSTGYTADYSAIDKDDYDLSNYT
jgi:hypothetical protein